MSAVPYFVKRAPLDRLIIAILGSAGVLEGCRAKPKEGRIDTVSGRIDRAIVWGTWGLGGRRSVDVAAARVQLRKGEAWDSTWPSAPAGVGAKSRAAKGGCGVGYAWRASGSSAACSRILDTFHIIRTPRSSRRERI